MHRANLRMCCSLVNLPTGYKVLHFIKICWCKNSWLITVIVLPLLVWQLSWVGYWQLTAQVKESDIPSFRCLLVEKRMRSSGCLLHRLTTRRASGLKISATLRKYFSSTPFPLPPSFFSCLRRTWVEWCYQDVWRGKVKGNWLNQVCLKDGHLAGVSVIWQLIKTCFFIDILQRTVPLHVTCHEKHKKNLVNLKNVYMIKTISMYLD